MIRKEENDRCGCIAPNVDINNEMIARLRRNVANILPHIIAATLSHARAGISLDAIDRSSISFDYQRDDHARFARRKIRPQRNDDPFVQSEVHAASHGCSGDNQLATIDLARRNAR